MAYTLDNFVRAVLSADATAGANTLLVAKAVAPLRDPPVASVEAPGVLVLQDLPTSPTKIEIVRYTGQSIAGNVVTLTGVTRGQEGTTAQAWSAGTPTFQGVTAGALADLQAALAAKQDAANLGSAAFASANAFLPAAGTAAAANKLATPRAIAIGGLLGGTADFDGSDNVTITVTMADGALSIAKTAGLQGALDGKATAAQGAKADTALQDASAFATAAQGIKADAAMAATGGTFTGPTTFLAPNDDTFHILATYGPGDGNKQLTLAVQGGAYKWISGGWYGTSNVQWLLGGGGMSLDYSGNLGTSGAITPGGGRKISKVTLSSAAPGTLADGELYLQY